jgi:hypothetical protein
MPSLFATGSRPLPVVVRRQLSCAVVVQRHCHLPPTPSAAVSGRCRSHRRRLAPCPLSAAASSHTPSSFNTIVIRVEGIVKFVEFVLSLLVSIVQGWISYMLAMDKHIKGRDLIVVLY